MIPVHVTWAASDVCDAVPAIRLLSVTSSEPDNAPGYGDGETTGDIAGVSLGTPDSDLVLRAERAAQASGRTYRLTYSVTDSSGNSASSLAIVTVPRDLGQGPEPLTMMVDRDTLPGKARIFWPVVPGAIAYDVISGDLGSMKVDQGSIRLGAVRVLASGLTQTELREGAAGVVPPVGKGIFYLIQYRSASGESGYGTESVPWPRIPDSCDGGCP
jgi:hypothetical protein